MSLHPQVENLLKAHADLSAVNANLLNQIQFFETAIAVLQTRLIREGAIPRYDIPERFLGRNRGRNAYDCGYERGWRGINKMVYGESAANHREAEADGFIDGRAAVDAALAAAAGGQ